MKMKKFLAMAMAAAMSLSLLAGCGSSAEPAASSGSASAGSTSQTGTANKLEQIKTSGKLVVGTSPDFVPMEFEDVSSGQKEYVGSDIELAKYIAQELGVELELKPMDFMSIQQAITSDVIDLGISGFAATDKRKEAMNLSDGYDLHQDSGHGLLVLADQADGYQTAEAFAGKKVAAQNASLQQTLVQNQLPEDTKLQPIGAITDGILMLETGKVDALAVSLDNADNFIKAHPTLAKAPFVFDYQAEGNVVAMKKGEDELLEAVNAIIADVNEQGLYQQWKDDAIALAQKLNIKLDQ